MPAVQSGIQNQLGHQHLQRGRGHGGAHHAAQPGPLEGNDLKGESFRSELVCVSALTRTLTLSAGAPCAQVFQCLLIDGENAGEDALREAEKFVISDQLFQEFLDRHSSVPCLVPESNEKVWHC